jgi:hypothetical protein
MQQSVPAGKTVPASTTLACSSTWKKRNKDTNVSGGSTNNNEKESEGGGDRERERDNGGTATATFSVRVRMRMWMKKKRMKGIGKGRMRHMHSMYIDTDAPPVGAPCIMKRWSENVAVCVRGERKSVNISNCVALGMVGCM